MSSSNSKTCNHKLTHSTVKVDKGQSHLTGPLEENIGTVLVAFGLRMLDEGCFRLVCH